MLRILIEKCVIESACEQILFCNYRPKKKIIKCRNKLVITWSSCFISPFYRISDTRRTRFTLLRDISTRFVFVEWKKKVVGVFRDRPIPNINKSSLRYFFSTAFIRQIVMLFVTITALSISNCHINLKLAFIKIRVLRSKHR